MMNALYKTEAIAKQMATKRSKATGVPHVHFAVSGGWGVRLNVTNPVDVMEGLKSAFTKSGAAAYKAAAKDVVEKAVKGKIKNVRIKAVVVDVSKDYVLALPVTPDGITRSDCKQFFSRKSCGFMTIPKTSKNTVIQMARKLAVRKGLLDFAVG